MTRARDGDKPSISRRRSSQRITARYGGTRLGRQELDGELIEERADALWTRDMIEAARVDERAGAEAHRGRGRSAGVVRRRRRTRAASWRPGSTRTGIGYVLADATARGLSPARWAERAVALYHRLEADRIVAEVNQGGDMVEAVIRQVDPERAGRRGAARSRGKYLRAEPVAALYEQGRVQHVGAFPELEDEMCDFGLGGLSSGRSPDRLDALVWALTELMLTEEGEPRVRGI